MDRINSLCFIEALERFAYLGFSSIFVFYMIKNGFSENEASAALAALGASIYSFGAGAEFFANKIFGLKNSVFISLICLFFGYFLLSFSLFFALFLIIFASALIKSTLSSLLALNAKNNELNAFSKYYLGVNSGCFLGQIALAFTSSIKGSESAFLLASASLFIANFIFLFGFKKYETSGKFHTKKAIFVLFILLIFAAILRNFSVFSLLNLASFFSFFCFFALLLLQKKSTKNANFKPFCLLLFAAIIFYLLIFQSFNTLNILLFKQLKITLFGYELPSVFFISFMFFTALASYKFHKKFTNYFSIFTQFIAGILLASASYLLAATTGFNLFSTLFIFLFLGLAQLLIGSAGLAAASISHENQTRNISLWFLASALAQGIEQIAVKFVDFSHPVPYLFANFALGFAAALLLIAFKKPLKFVNFG